MAAYVEPRVRFQGRIYELREARWPDYRSVDVVPRARVDQLEQALREISGMRGVSASWLKGLAQEALHPDQRETT